MSASRRACFTAFGAGLGKGCVRSSPNAIGAAESSSMRPRVNSRFTAVVARCSALFRDFPFPFRGIRSFPPDTNHCNTGATCCVLRAAFVQLLTQHAAPGTQHFLPPVVRHSPDDVGAVVG